MLKELRNSCLLTFFARLIDKEDSAFLEGDFLLLLDFFFSLFEIETFLIKAIEAAQLRFILWSPLFLMSVLTIITTAGSHEKGLECVGIEPRDSRFRAHSTSHKATTDSPQSKLIDKTWSETDLAFNLLLQISIF